MTVDEKGLTYIKSQTGSLIQEIKATVILCLLILALPGHTSGMLVFQKKQDIDIHSHLWKLSAADAPKFLKHLFPAIPTRQLRIYVTNAPQAVILLVSLAESAKSDLNKHQSSKQSLRHRFFQELTIECAKGGPVVLHDTCKMRRHCSQLLLNHGNTSWKALCFCR